MIWIELGIIAVLLIFSAFFSAAEMALAAVSKPRLKQMIKKYPRQAPGFRLWLKDPNKLLSAILVGVNVVNVCAASLVGLVSVQLAQNYHWNAWLVWILTTVGMTVIVIIVCEVAPKMIAINNPLRVVIRIIPLIMLCQRLLAPISSILVFITAKALGLFGVKHNNSLPVVTEDDIRTIIDVGKEEGAIAKQEGRMLQSVLAFRDTIVREVMVPRNKMVMVSADADYQVVLDLIIRRGLSRVPVYKGNRDSIVGILYAKDFLAIIKDKKQFAMKDIYRAVCFVPETKKISQLLLEFQRGRLHQAIAVDEYGGVAGLVTLEDIIEELVGEIRDEYDQAETENIIKTAEHEYLVKGCTDIDDVNRELDLKLQKTEGVETISGFVVDILGTLPRVGEIIKLSEVVIRVKEVEQMRVESLSMTVRSRGRRQVRSSEKRRKKDG